MELALVDLRADEVIGTPDYSDTGILPVRMRRLAPEAYDAFGPISKVVVVSDMFRSAEASLNAIRRKAGAAAPSRSAHNYGRALDLDIIETLKRNKDLKRKRDLDKFMESHGWYCHRRDHRMRSEAWHFNHLGLDGGGYLKASDPRTSWAIERLLKDRYGSCWELTVEEQQRALALLRLYGGAIDGIWGDLSTEACRCFQRTWDLVVDGICGTVTQRTLAYVTATRFTV